MLDARRGASLSRINTNARGSYFLHPGVFASLATSLLRRGKRERESAYSFSRMAEVVVGGIV